LWARRGVEYHRVRKTLGGSDFFSKIRSDVTVATEYAAHGIRVEQANVDRVAGAAQILKLLGDLERGDRPRIYITEDCPRTIEALQNMQHDPHRPEDVLKVDVDDDGEGGDDFYDALRYLVMAATKGGSFAMGAYG
jgi:hypothetical protein